MSVDVIQFGNNQPSLDIPGDQSTQQTGSVMRDVYVDLSGNIVKRPVLDLFCDTGETTAVNGLYDWTNIADGSVYPNNVMIAIAGGSPFRIREYTASYINEITTGTYAAFGTDQKYKVSFAETGTGSYSTAALYACNGGKIKRIYLDTGTWTCADLTDADAPTSVNSIAVFDNYLTAVESGTGNFHWSDVNAPTTWSGYYANAESNPDRLYSIHQSSSYLFLVGKKTVEVFYNDGVTPFSRLTQGVVPYGSAAIRGAVYAEAINAFVFRTGDNRIVRTQATDAVSLSKSLDAFLSYNYSTGPTDDVGHYFVYEGIPFYLYSSFGGQYGFTTIQAVGGSDTGPTSGFSVIVNLMNGDWYEWGSYYSTQDRYLPFQAASILNTPAGIFVGDPEDGLIHKMTRSGVDDTAYGEIKPMIRSVHIDRGAPGTEKICNSLTFSFKAPQTHYGGAFGLTVKYSDDGGSTWSDGREVVADISTGQKAKIITERNWGRYCQRQWMIEFDTTKDIALGPVVEDFDYVY